MFGVNIGSAADKHLAFEFHLVEHLVFNLIDLLTIVECLAFDVETDEHEVDIAC